MPNAGRNIKKLRDTSAYNVDAHSTKKPRRWWDLMRALSYFKNSNTMVIKILDIEGFLKQMT